LNERWIKAKRAIIFDESGRNVAGIGLIAATIVAEGETDLSVMRSDQSKNAARMLHLGLDGIK
jgi:hypothetical protein